MEQSNKYTCDFCSKQYSRKDNLKRHYLSCKSKKDLEEKQANEKTEMEKLNKKVCLKSKVAFRKITELKEEVVALRSENSDLNNRVLEMEEKMKMMEMKMEQMNQMFNFFSQQPKVITQVEEEKKEEVKPKKEHKQFNKDEFIKNNTATERASEFLKKNIKYDDINKVGTIKFHKSDTSKERIMEMAGLKTALKTAVKAHNELPDNEKVFKIIDKQRKKIIFKTSDGWEITNFKNNSNEEANINFMRVIANSILGSFVIRKNLYINSLGYDSMKDLPDNYYDPITNEKSNRIIKYYFRLF